jgi:hypothetical protein
METALLILITAMLLAILGLLHSSYNNNYTQKNILAILKDLQDITNLDTTKQTDARLVDVNKREERESALDNLTRDSSIWEEESLEGEEIEEVYGR